ncbi:MAG: V-type ATP synthase subunit B [Candidatus Methanomethylicia archaeon]|nr:V-type ATP synthase subunit B [Candidatus Methanomethylicia archaeon]MCX8169115.1 V-type ATP synthase subunit B [Candidatus Methanomethylicia archaeon]MDW7988847.1 V-type ATP synthase subunit B [Nitrososphaerota archaeon]
MSITEKWLKFRTVSEIRGPLLVVRGVRSAAYGEIVRIETPDGEIRTGQVLETGYGYAIIQVFEGTKGLDIKNTTVMFTGETMKFPVSMEVLSRIFNGRGETIDNKPPPLSFEELDVNGAPINPSAREYPKEFIQTGISAIDGMNTLSRGQKLPLFTESGLPHNILAAQIARQATIPGKEEDFVIVFAAMGITVEDAIYFRNEFEKTGALGRSVMFLNLAEDPAIERIITPRLALTTAEYLAFHQDMHVLVILTDMLNYGEALREISAAREEVPGRRGYPGYLYTDLATIYERCGRIRNRKGSITLMPIVTMPGGDITHPVVDLTGYITEGQIYLDRALHRKGIYPPINVLPSLSRLMKEATRYTREDHQSLSDQLYYCYAEGVELRGLVAVIGEEAITERDKKYLEFADAFEREFISQEVYENRSLRKTLEIGWDLLSKYIPESDWKRIDPSIIEKYSPKKTFIH